MEIFVLIFAAVFLYILAVNIKEFIDNENSPVLTQTAVLVQKRRHTTNSNGAVSTTYTAQFQLPETGEALRCRIPRRVFRALEEDALGRLTHQGTRFLAFEWNGQRVEK